MQPHPSLLVRAGQDDNSIRRAAAKGDLVRVWTGRYVRSCHWRAWSPAQRYVMRAMAASTASGRPLVLSHASAASFWNFPRLGQLPPRVHLVDPTAVTSRSRAGVTVHAGPLEQAETLGIDGCSVTSLVRTAVDIALTANFRQATVALDHGLFTGAFTRDDLRASLENRPTARARRRVDDCIEFADGRANRPGESLSRVVMREERLTPPSLQREFATRSGTYFVDFWWSEWGIVGEFDGFVKYRDAALRAGKSPEQVVIDEKLREDAIRAHPDVRTFVRWTWRDAMAPGVLGTRLRSAGVR